jgi:formiminoglutamase
VPLIKAKGYKEKMKIISFNPGSLTSPADLDTSKLAYHSYPVALSELKNREHGIVLIGFADDTGVKNVGGRPGAKDAPAAVRQKLYKFTLGKPTLPFYDLGDLAPAATIEATHEQGKNIVQVILEAGHYPIVLGGGHDLAYPHALAFLEKFGATSVFWNIDAHLDVRPTHNGITSGSPWYMLREHPTFPAKAKIAEFGLQPHCNSASLVAYAEKRKFELHWLSDIRRKKAPADITFQRLLGRLTAKASGLVSLDIDSVNWAEAPGCSAPQTEGFTAGEAIRMSRESGACSRVKSFGIFELSPALDPDGRTANLVAHCVAACVEGIGSRTKPRKK